MTDSITTIDPDSLAERTAASDELFAVVFAPGGQLQKLAFEKLLAKLIAADLCKTTEAILQADLAHDADSVALVFNDPGTLKNGWWRKIGATGSGSWLQFEELSKSVRQAALDAAEQAEAAAESAEAAMAGIEAEAVATGVYRQQLFNPSDSTDGQFVAADGSLSANTNYFASDWMAWPDGVSEVCITWANFIVQATESGGVYTVVGGTYINPNSAAYVLTKSGGATHFRISGQKGNIAAAQQMVVRGSTLPADYIAFEKVIDGSKLRPKTVAGSALEDDTVTPDKVSFLSVSKNLFNVATILPDYFMGTTGALTANSTYSVSDYIPVTPGETYVSSQNGVLSNLRMWCFFSDTSGTVVAGGSNEDGSSFTVPAGAYYVRVTHYNVRLAKAQIELGSTPTSWLKYGYTLAGSALEDDTITPDKVSFLSVSKNLFNVATILPDYFMGTSGTLTANSTYSVSDYIPVTPGETYVSSQNGVLSNLRMWCFFSNTSGTVVAGGSNEDGSSFMVPAGAYYVRVTHYNARLIRAQIELGSAPTGWVKYGYTLNPDGYSSSGGSAGGWSGRKWGRLGDSNTAARPWANTTAQVLALTAYDYGAGGTQVGGAPGSTTAMFSDTRINAMDSSLDLITFMGGTNDWFNNRALGAVTSTNSEEFNGALNLMAEKLINRYPDDFVVFVTPIWTHARTWSAKGWANPYTNTLGLTPRDYADAIAACGKRYNIPVIDLMAQLSWNRLNITTYVADDGELLHPNTAGNNRMAQVYCGALANLQPVA